MHASCVWVMTQGDPCLQFNIYCKILKDQIMRNLFGVAFYALLLASSILMYSCSNEEDNFDYPDDKYGVYIVHTEGGDLGRLIAKYDIVLYPYIAVDGVMEYEDFSMLKHLQKTLMYLNLEKVNVVSSTNNDGKTMEAGLITGEHMMKNGKHAFPLLHTVHLPKDLKKIGENAFSGSNVKKLVIHNKLTTIENSAFENCRLLSEINLPGSINYIGENAFKGCLSLSSVTIPSSVEVIYVNSFDNRFVKSIHMRSNVPPMLKNTDGNTSKTLDSESRPTIYVPKGAKARYEADEAWSSYRIIEG